MKNILYLYDVKQKQDMRKSFLVVSRFTYDYETELRFKLFHHRENAKKYFDEMVKGEEEDSWIADRTDVVVTKREEYFEAYKDGYASVYSTEISIEELQYADAE